MTYFSVCPYTAIPKFTALYGHNQQRGVINQIEQAHQGSVAIRPDCYS